MIPDELKHAKPLTGKERLGANRNSDYLGVEDFEPDSEPTLTIAALYNAEITLQMGKERHDVIAFKEESIMGSLNRVKPLVLNATNRKTIRKIYRSLTAENLVGKQITLYIDPTARNPKTGEKGGIRIRPRVPSVQTQQTCPILCADCGQPITSVGTYSTADIAQINEKRFGRKLCAACSKKLAEQAKQEQPKPEEPVAEEPKPQSSLAESLMEE